MSLILLNSQHCFGVHLSNLLCMRTMKLWTKFPSWRLNQKHSPEDRLLLLRHTQSAEKRSGADWATARRGEYYWSTSPWWYRNPCREDTERRLELPFLHLSVPARAYVCVSSPERELIGRLHLLSVRRTNQVDHWQLDCRIYVTGLMGRRQKHPLKSAF